MTIKKQLILMIIMICASLLAVYLKPSIQLSLERKNFNLENIIPSNFGDWHKVEVNQNYIVNPQQQELVNKIYSQILNRVYQNSKGQQVILTIAYGDNQSDSSQLHYPEICYPAQGFQIIQNNKGEIRTEFGALKVKRLVATLSSRVEPITYWATIGDKVVQGANDTKIEKLKYGFRGYIPDGLLFRVSSISKLVDEEFDLQDSFINDILIHIDKKQRKVISGFD